MTILNTNSYNQTVSLVPESWRTHEDNEYAENYTIAWSWDYRDSKGFRATQVRSKRTTLKGAQRFAKKHGIKEVTIEN